MTDNEDYRSSALKLRNQTDLKLSALKFQYTDGLLDFLHKSATEIRLCLTVYELAGRIGIPALFRQLSPSNSIDIGGGQAVWH